MKRILYLIFLFIVLGGGNQIKSQISSGGIPHSFTSGEFSTFYQEIVLTVPSWDELYEDSKNNDKIDLPHRFAKLIPVNLNPENSGTWEDLDNGARVWRLGLFAENAEAMCLYFDDF